MNEVGKRCFTILLVSISSLIGSNEVLGETKSATSKKAFASLLARGATAAAPRSERAVVAKERTARAAHETIHSGRSANIRRLASGDGLGLSASTPVVPSGRGSGRDAYVEAFYSEIMGRQATQSEVDHWAQVLASGIHANVVSASLWNSPEHKSLVRNGEAPEITFAVAYRKAYAVGLANCKERLAREARHHDQQ